MEDNIKPEDGNGKLIPEQDKKEPVKELKLSITKNIETGSISVQGPGNGQFYDKYICCGLLDDAKDFIKVHNARVNMDRIKPASSNFLNGIRNRLSRR